MPTSTRAVTVSSFASNNQILEDPTNRKEIPIDQHQEIKCYFGIGSVVQKAWC
jgi:hypothetical protein